MGRNNRAALSFLLLPPSFSPVKASEAAPSWSMSSLVGRPLGGATAAPSKRDLATTNIPARSPPKAAARAIPAATSSSSAATEPPRKAGRAIPPSTGKRVGVLTATNSTKAGGSAGGGGGTSIGMRASGVKQVGGERELKTVVQPARVLLSSAAASGLKAPTTVSGGKGTFVSLCLAKKLTALRRSCPLSPQSRAPDLSPHGLRQHPPSPTPFRRSNALRTIRLDHLRHLRNQLDAPRA